MELGGAADAVDEPIAIVALGVMKHHGTTRAIFPEGFNNWQNPQRKSALRPSQRRVLQKDPGISFVVDLLAKLAQSPAPPFCCPLHSGDLERKCVLLQRCSQISAIFFDRIC